MASKEGTRKRNSKPSVLGFLSHGPASAARNSSQIAGQPAELRTDALTMGSRQRALV